MSTKRWGGVLLFSEQEEEVGGGLNEKVRGAPSVCTGVCGWIDKEPLWPRALYLTGRPTCTSAHSAHLFKYIQQQLEVVGWGGRGSLFPEFPGQLEPCSHFPLLVQFSHNTPLFFFAFWGSFCNIVIFGPFFPIYLSLFDREDADQISAIFTRYKTSWCDFINWSHLRCGFQDYSRFSWLQPCRVILQGMTSRKTDPTCAANTLTR